MVWLTLVAVIFPMELYYVTKTTWRVSKYVYKIISNNLGSSSKKQQQ
jgi:hypothetical protein